jgi:aminomethyltransferase
MIMGIPSPLHDLHEKAGATFTEFAGHTMPLQFSSIKDEHLTVRKKVGLFDVSHMGNAWITGPDAEALLTLTTMEDAARIGVGKSQYTAFLREDGTIIDDTIFMHVDDRFMIIPNAGCSEMVTTWLNKQVQQHGLDAHVTDVSSDYVILALQGPHAKETLKQVTDESIDDIGFFGNTKMTIAGVDCIISFTGYTGEQGFEFQINDPKQAQHLFQTLLKEGKSFDIKPIGLGARDTLRLEKFFLLAGNEFVGGRSPLEANIGFFLHWDHSFIGKEALLEQKEQGGYERLTALKCLDRGIPRHGCVVQKDNDPIGVVSSGTMSPCLETGIAMAYMQPDHIKLDNKVEILIRGRPVKAIMVKPPFVPQDWAKTQY